MKKKAVITVLILAILAIMTYTQTCPKGCSACDTAKPPNCSGCSAGFVRNGTKCLQCPRDCSACNLPSGGATNLVCTTCVNPSVNILLNGICRPCNPDCAQGQCTTNHNTCSACRYSIAPVSGACTYPTCIAGCGDCTPGASTCTTCMPGFYKDGGNLCQRCTRPCLQCTGASAGSCTKCQKGTYNNAGNCSPCPNNALVCTSSAVTTCKLGFVPNGNQCDPCTAPCMTCSTNPTTCDSCIPPATLHAGNVCRVCNKPCLTCNSGAGNQDQCLTCQKGFSLKANNNQCFRCAQRLCRDCDPADNTKCIQCQVGAALNSTGNCNPCPIGCQQCNSDQKVENQRDPPPQSRLLQQQPPSDPNAPGSGQGTTNSNANPNNNNVNAGNDNIGGDSSSDRRVPGGKPLRPTLNCLKCQIGSVLINGRCQPCQLKGCKVCDPNRRGVCLTCQDGTYEQRGKCKRCQKGCDLCIGALDCDVVSKGWVQLPNGKIVRCRPGCGKCDPTDPSNCLMAADGFYLIGSSPNIATMCPYASNCKACNPSTPTTCTACYRNQHQIGLVCKACAPSCLTCQGGNDAGLLVCKSCPKGAFLRGTQCVKANQTCGQKATKCSRRDNTKCQQCQYGYTCTDDGKCAKCFGGCSKCAYKQEQIGQVCLDCPRGFEKNGTRCVRCPQGCDNCKRGNCNQCEPMYQLRQLDNTIKCAPRCHFPCTNCTLTNNTDGVLVSTCNQCMEGYNLSGDRCVPACTTSCARCVLGTYKNVGDCPLCAVNGCATCADGTNLCYGCFPGNYLTQARDACNKCPQGCFQCFGPDKCQVCSIGFFKQVIEQSDDKLSDLEADTCSKCSTNCYTCIGRNNTCTSCRSGFFLNGTRCSTLVHIQVKVKFDTDYGQYLRNGNGSDVQASIQRKRDQKDFQQEDNFQQDTYSTSGSVQSQAVFTGNDQDNIYDLMGVVMDGYYASGFPILSMDIAVYDQSGNRLSGGLSAGAIVGIVLGCVAFVAIIIAIIVCVWWRKKKAAQAQVGGSIPQEGGSFNQSANLDKKNFAE